MTWCIGGALRVGLSDGQNSLGFIVLAAYYVSAQPILCGSSGLLLLPYPTRPQSTQEATVHARGHRPRKRPQATQEATGHARGHTYDDVRGVASPQ